MKHALLLSLLIPWQVVSRSEDTLGCGSSEFACQNGDCIASSSVCDDIVDCNASEDELDCLSDEHSLTTAPSETDEPSPSSETDDASPSSAPSETGEASPSSAPSETDEASPSSAPSETAVASPSSAPSETDEASPSSAPSDTDEASPSSAPSETDAPSPITLDATSVVCDPSEFSCQNGDCIASSMVCDGIIDCSTSEDEVDCSTDEPFPSSAPSETQAPSPSSVPSLETASVACSSSEFTCQNGDCIANSWVCDGVIDCKASEDELDCTVDESSPSSAPSETDAPSPSSILSPVMSENDSSTERDEGPWDDEIGDLHDDDMHLDFVSHSDTYPDKQEQLDLGCASGLVLETSYCPALECTAPNISASTPVETKDDGLITACRCADHQIISQGSCTDVYKCPTICATVRISHFSGDNVLSIDSDYVFQGVYDSTLLYRMSNGGDIYLWRYCRNNAWVLAPRPGELGVLGAYSFSTAIQPEHIAGPWVVFQGDEYFYDFDLRVYCVAI